MALLTDKEIQEAIATKVGYDASDIILIGIEKEVAKAQDVKTLKAVVELVDNAGLIEHTDSPLHKIGATILDCPACCWYAYKKEWGIE